MAAGSARRRALRVLRWVPLALVLKERVGSIHSISGSSMLPTLDGRGAQWAGRDHVFVRAVDPREAGRRVRRGEVVALRSPADPHLRLAKRVVALSGDTVLARGGAGARRVVVPDGHVWVEGDNPRWSADSNRFGPVPAGLIYGRVLCICYPPARWAWVPVDHRPNPRVHRRDSTSYVAV